ncbi:hypothetical protein GOP47_0013607 [Adiantum capillus-veneris]|uniref:50S ribosomal protein L19, chloroplastic n=1 Tax=Adiantum capillus-veneris TaxID=13818 RepID=A0A9D4UPJ4_ADICA|nr:hypothetical protein GOP47_0013607 [Adiantum capillus-veneris]
MASSCLRQVAASPAGFKTLVLSSTSSKPCRGAAHVKVQLACSFRGSALRLAVNASQKSNKHTRAIVAAEAVAETAEVEAEVVVSADEAPIVEVEQPEAPLRTGKSRKTKGLKNIMETLHKRAIEAATEGKNIPDIRTGDIVQLRVEVPENKKRVSLLRGICIGRQNAGIHTTFRIRRVIAGVGVEMVFPLYSPNIKEIKVIDKRKVRRAKLFYLRDKIARLSSC